MKPNRLDHLRGLRPARVCLIKPSSLGDIVHALPVLASLRAHWPAARICLGDQPGAPGAPRRPPRPRRGHPLRPGQAQGDPGRPGGDGRVPPRPPPPAVRPGDRPPGVAPIGDHDRGHRRPPPGRPGRGPRGGPGLLQRISPLARPRGPRRRPPAPGGRGVRGGRGLAPVPGRLRPRRSRAGDPGPGAGPGPDPGHQHRRPLADQALAAGAICQRSLAARSPTEGPAWSWSGRPRTGRWWTPSRRRSGRSTG